MLHNPTLSIGLIIQSVNPILKKLRINSRYHVAGVIISPNRNNQPNKQLIRYCTLHKIPFIIFNKKQPSETVQWIQQNQISLLVVRGMSQLLPESIFTAPQYKTINIHPSLLPAYRGANPLFWQYYDNCHTTGVTIHYIAKGEDTGDILYQKEIPFPRGIRYEKLQHQLLYEQGYQALCDVLKTIETKNTTTQSQPIQSPTPQAKNIDPKTFSEYINSNWTGERVWHFLRGNERFIYTLFPFHQNKNVWRVEKFVNQIPQTNIGHIQKLSPYLYTYTAKDALIYIRKMPRWMKLFNRIFSYVR